MQSTAGYYGHVVELNVYIVMVVLKFLNIITIDLVHTELAT